MSPINYRLELPTQWSIHPVFHIDLLMPYRETIMHGTNYQRPPLDLVDNEEEYKVKKILDSQLFGWRKRLQYLVKWKGYLDSDNMCVTIFLSLLSPYYTQIHRTASFLLSPILSPGSCTFTISSCCLLSCTICI